MSDVHVHMLPALLDPRSLRGGVAVVIDILRATTTIIHALAGGAKSVRPCGTVDAARALAQQIVADQPGERVLLGGERHGQLIEGFDLDNSPLQYGPETVAGRTIVFTTTNGTRALESCRDAERILIGGFVNHAALVDALRTDGRPIHLLCAGTDGYLTAEDILFAGAVALALVPAPCGRPGIPADFRSPGVDVQTQMALDFAASRCRDAQTRLATLRDSRGGRNLLELGHVADIERAAELDRFAIVPEWDRATGVIDVQRRPG